MKCALKCVGLLFIGLLTAVVIYPTLHEFGHAITAIMFRAKVIEFKILPQAYVICEMGDVSKLGRVFIGLAGTVFPVIISLVNKVKMFWIWYVNMIIRCISVLSLSVSLIVIILHMFGISVTNDDMLQVLSIWNGGEAILLLCTVTAIVLIVVSIICEKPIIKISEFFELNQNHRFNELVK